MKSEYLKQSVQPIIVKRTSNDTISIRYTVPPETVMYSKGVNYSISNNEIKIVIDRCHINGKCNPMSQTTIPLGSDWQAEVTIPYHGEKVVMVYSDAEEQVYP